jgi:hypothetical protein
MSEEGAILGAGAAPSPGPEAAATAARLRDGLRPCLTVFLGARTLLFALSAFGVGLAQVPPGQPTSVPGWAAPALGPGWHTLFTAMERQDALWFLRIATQGYRSTDMSAAFFPLYPAAIRVVSLLTFGHPLFAATVVSNLCFLGALILLHDLTRQEFGSAAVAGRAVLLIAVFPAAFFLMAPYSESLFLLLSVAAFRSARRDRWGWAALFGLSAALTRSVGIALAPALAVEAVHQWRSDGRGLWPRLAVSLAPVAGLGLVFGLWWRRSGDALAPIHVQAGWRPYFGWPWATFWHGIRQANLFQSYWLLDALLVSLAVVSLLAGVLRLRPSYLVYALVSLALPLFAEYPDRPFLSMPRFLCVIFPLFWMPARWAERRPGFGTATVVAFAAGFGLFAVLFMNWLYIF